MVKLTDKKAHAQLKALDKQRNAIGVGGYKDSRRSKCEQHETFNKAMTEMNKLSDESKLEEIENE